MDKKIPIFKIFEISIYILLFFVFFGMWLGVNLNKKIISTAKLWVSESTNDMYTFSLDKLKIDLLNHTITLNNLIIAPTKKEILSKTKFVIQIKVLRIIDFSILSYLKGHNLVIDRVEFEEPRISVYQGSEQLPKSKILFPENKISIFSIFKKKLNSISIGHMDVINSRFNMYKSNTDSVSFFSTNDNSLSVVKFIVNSETDKSNRLFSAEKFEMVMNKFSYHSDNGLYILYGKRAYASYLDSVINIDSLQLIPMFSKKEFGNKAGRQISRAKIISSKVKGYKVDVKLFLECNRLNIHRVEIEECAFDVFRDNRLPLASILRPSLQALVKNIPFVLSVDSIELKKGEVAFEALNPSIISRAKISLNKMDAIITGIQNDSSTYTSDQSIKAFVNGYVLNQGKFSEIYTFPLKATKELFYCSGTLTSMPMASFNSMLRSNKNVFVTSGQLDFVSFSFVAYANSSKGTMRFMYHDLKVEAVNKSSKKGRIKEKLKSFLMNELVIRDSNPGKDGLVRTSEIYTKHNPYRFFLNYSMQSILSGIAPVIEDKKNAKRLLMKKE